MTAQWFAELGELREAAPRRSPTWRCSRRRGRTRLEALSARAEWRLSRQRSWGVSAGVLPCGEWRGAAHRGNGRARAAARRDARGLVVLVGARRGGAAAAATARGHLWRKGTDTLDVWFDSGRRGAPCSRRPMGRPAGRADMRLEGSDQHRGWPSRRCSRTRARPTRAAPYAAVVSHGFVVDEGAKMSKSVGNVITPRQLIEQGLPRSPWGRPGRPRGGGRGRALQESGRKEQKERPRAARGQAGAVWRRRAASVGRDERLDIGRRRRGDGAPEEPRGVPPAAELVPIHAGQSV